MSIEWPTVIEGGIPILGGSMQQPSDMESSAPHSLLERVQADLLARFKWLGPAVVLFGVFTAWQTHLRVIHPPAEELARQIAAR